MGSTTYTAWPRKKGTKVVLGVISTTTVSFVLGCLCFSLSISPLIPPVTLCFVFFLPTPSVYLLLLCSSHFLPPSQDHTCKADGTQLCCFLTGFAGAMVWSWLILLLLRSPAFKNLGTVPKDLLINWQSHSKLLEHPGKWGRGGWIMLTTEDRVGGEQSYTGGSCYCCSYWCGLRLL